MKISTIERTLSYLDKMEAKLADPNLKPSEEAELRSSLELIRSCDINDQGLEMHLNYVNYVHNLNFSITQNQSDLRMVVNVLETLVDENQYRQLMSICTRK